MKYSVYKKLEYSLANEPDKHADCEVSISSIVDMIFCCVISMYAYLSYD